MSRSPSQQPTVSRSAPRLAVRAATGDYCYGYWFSHGRA